MVFTAIDAADVSMFAERVWLLDALQDLYKLARGKQPLDRQSFLKVLYVYIHACVNPPTLAHGREESSCERVLRA
jgi:hypothetical protein